ncbi:MAG: nitroreductase [Candidatus Lokiarchaeota archaeon]|nr:nitroreductase [Candidatus Lokiarchaeota archaeon]
MELTSNEFIEFIKERKSVRSFVYKTISKDIINNIIEAARWAPSGNNSQPWKVCIVIHPTLKRMLADLTKYGGTIEEAYVNFVIFLDLERGYDRTKDLQAIGAFIQNMLLAVHAQEDLGAVWIGEIINRKEEVNEIFKFPVEKFELMGVVAMGIVDEAREKAREESRERRSVDEFTDWY